MKPANNDRRCALLALAIAAGMAMATANAGVQQALTDASYAPSISINVPLQTPTPICTPIPAGAPTEPWVVKRTFLETFDTLDLKSHRWTPHFDGGYDDVNHVWRGDDWIVKRTQPAMHEQELYVDPDYRGTTKAPLGLNPFIIDKGVLHIVARRTPDNLIKALSGFEYISGALTTRESFIQRYGYFEARIKVPSTQALLPAFWMLPFNKTWPPELDVMEAPTQYPNMIEQTAHWKDASGKLASSGCKTIYKNYSADFHQYGALWTEQKIVYFIDRVPVAQVATPPGMNLPMYMQINLAVGGDWIGKATAATPMPVEMLVNKVVAYSSEGPSACVTLSNGVMQCLSK